MAFDKAKHDAERRERKLRTCWHFNGIQHDACSEGVRYADVPRPLPCLPTGAPGGCPKFRAWTPEEVDADEAAVEQLFARLRERAERNECLHCGAAIQRRVVVGKCAYAEPCGHRQGQVR
jgi:hypothetical protein